jgi:hypothetical protein
MKQWMKFILPALCVLLGAGLTMASGVALSSDGVICRAQVGDQNSGECAACCQERLGGVTADPIEVNACWTFCKAVRVPD